MLAASFEPVGMGLFCAPGNPGINQLAKPVRSRQSDFAALVAFAKENKIDLTIVGPDDPHRRRHCR